MARENWESDRFFAILKQRDFVFGKMQSTRRDQIELSVMRPLTQLGGISYSRIRETFELPLPAFASEMEKKGEQLGKFLDTITDGQNLN